MTKTLVGTPDPDPFKYDRGSEEYLAWLEDSLNDSTELIEENMKQAELIAEQRTIIEMQRLLITLLVNNGELNA